MVVRLSIFLLLALQGAALGGVPAKGSTEGGYAGSKSCQECHERFYGLWSTSFHGLAMQPFSETLSRDKLTPQKDDLVIGKERYRADSAAGVVRVTGLDGKQLKYKIEYALGGKNVYYFLTLLEKGRLQTLPVAYDVRKREWFDTALSGLRHFPGQQGREEPVGWQEWPYTFNSSCYGCHVSQLSSNYDQKSDSYATTWREPGINCESCHGPSGAHISAMRLLPVGGRPANDAGLQLLRTKSFIPSQHNDACNSCHSKAKPLTTGYRTPERFFDHFDLVTLEDPDFYPDGRDLGENYTQSSWRLSPCVKGGKLHCVTCHTSSGRYRFSKPGEANKACLPCHEERVKNVAAHSHHPAEGAAGSCISCHMPKTEFARMQRTDHSLLPPTPATTIAYGSPNACNLCHRDKDAAWADRQVRQWSPKEYQSPILKRAALIQMARKRDWSRLPEMLTYVGDPQSNEIFTASLLRLLANNNDPATVATLRACLTNPSPLVRAAALEGLATAQNPELLQDIVAAAGDDYRLVRVRAAALLAQFSLMPPQGKGAGEIRKATDEYLAELMARPDIWDAHYNLGNYFLGLNRPAEALVEYDEALKREPQATLVLVNAALAHAQRGETTLAEGRLNAALKIAPDSAAVRYNLGLLKAEQGDLPAAEANLKLALKIEPQMAEAAYNLCVITARDRLDAALPWCRKAADLKPHEPRYASTFAYYQRNSGDISGAIGTLEGLISRYPGYRDAWLLLAEIYVQQGKRAEATQLYRRALAAPELSDQVKEYLRTQTDAVK
jgi:Tfp pilus assembly protein PilF